METRTGEIQTNNDVMQANVFAKSGKLQRSPARNTETPANVSSGSKPGAKGGLGTALSQMLTPKTDGLQKVRASIDELYDFIKDKHNVHTQIKQLVASIKSAVAATEREQKHLKARAETAENALKEAARKSFVKSPETPRRPPDPNPRTDKRKRETPGEEEEQKKAKNDEEKDPAQGEGSKWRTVSYQKDRKQNEVREKPKPRMRREKSKGDALVIAASGTLSYADILRKVRGDPKLHELGERVVRTRRTQKGEMILELEKDPSVKSTAFKKLVSEALGDEANVKALSQETVIECRDLDEITTEQELRNALTTQCTLDSVPLDIRLRKAYGGTQTAVIRLPAVAAPKLLQKGKIKVGWSVCALRIVPRVAKQMERCFKCWAFGHQARNCDGPDRSKSCRKCGEDGHYASECTKPPRCVLCKKEDGNDHMTGGFKCPAYKKAKASEQ